MEGSNEELLRRHRELEAKKAAGIKRPLNLGVNLKPKKKREKKDKILNRAKKAGSGIVKDMRGSARDIVEASKKIPGAVGRGARATVKEVKDDVAFFAPMGDEIKDSFAEATRGLKKAGRKGIEVGKNTVSIMAEGHNRSTNPEYGQPLDERPQAEAERQKGPSLKERLSKILARKEAPTQDFDLENKTIAELETIRAQITSELLPGIANGEVNATLVEAQSEIDRLIEDQEEKELSPKIEESAAPIEKPQESTLEQEKENTLRGATPKQKSKLSEWGYQHVDSISFDEAEKLIAENEQKWGIQDKSGSVRESEVETKNEVSTESQQKILEEIKEMPKAEREKLGFGLHRMGFSFEQHKNQFFAKVFGFFADTNLDQNKTTTRFMKKVASKFEKKSDTAHKKAKEDKEGTHKRQVVNAIGIIGNTAKYGRVISDLTTHSLASPLRYVMMAGMAFTGAAEAAKEVRFENEELIDKTRIVDAERAAEEAWRIYERAQAKLNDSSGINMQTEALKDAYLMEMPADLKKRLENPGVANGMVQSIVKKDLQFTVNRLNTSLDKIDDTKLTPEEKNAKKEKLLKKWESNLEDYDRLVTQYGTVDGLALAGMYAQTAGRTVVAALTVETIILSVEKLFGSLAHAQVATNAHKVIPGMEKADATAVASAGKGAIAPFPQGLGEHGVSPEHTTGILENAAGAPASPDAAHAVNAYEIVHKGQGVEHALIRDIEHNQKLAQDLGFKGDINDAKALHEFAGKEAHRIALQTGYVDGAGHEVRITQADKVGYEIKMENGHAVVIEKTVDGKALGEFHQGDEFGTNSQNPYEKIVDTGHHEAVSHLASTPDTGTEAGLKAHILEKMNAETNLTPHVVEPQIAQSIQHPIEGVKTLSPEHVLGTADQSAPVAHAPFQPHSGTFDLYNQFNLSTKMLERVHTIEEHNIARFFPTDTKDVWNTVKDTPPEELWSTNPEDVDKGLNPFIDYLTRLLEKTHLSPLQETPFQHAETSGEYMTRALQYIAAKMPGDLDKIKIP